MTRDRDREREQLAGRLVALSLGISTAVIVTGEPGVGKTHLAVDLLRASEGYGRITVLAGSCDDVDPRPYHAWKRVFARYSISPQFAIPEASHAGQGSGLGNGPS